jgi:hypothetical protein
MKTQTERKYSEYIKSKTLPELAELAKSINKSALPAKFALIKKRILYLKRRQKLGSTFKFKTRISSPEGMVLKYVIGPLMICIPALVTLGLLFGSQSILLAILPAGICLLAIWLFRMEYLQYREVYVDSSYLYVKHGSHEVSIPISNIKRLRETVATNIRPITIYFQFPTEIGDKVTFVPLRESFFSSGYDRTVITLLEQIKVRIAKMNGDG